MDIKENEDGSVTLTLTGLEATDVSNTLTHRNISKLTSEGMLDVSAGTTSVKVGELLLGYRTEERNPNSFI